MSTFAATRLSGSTAPSASMSSASPPFRWHAASAASARVPLPLPSRPASSVMPPGGRPPVMRSKPRDPVESGGPAPAPDTGQTARSAPQRMM